MNNEQTHEDEENLSEEDILSINENASDNGNDTVTFNNNQDNETVVSRSATVQEENNNNVPISEWIIQLRRLRRLQGLDPIEPFVDVTQEEINEMQALQVYNVSGVSMFQKAIENNGKIHEVDYIAMRNMSNLRKEILRYRKTDNTKGIQHHLMSVLLTQMSAK